MHLLGVHSNRSQVVRQNAAGACAAVCGNCQSMVHVSDMLGTPAEQFAERSKVLCCYATSMLVHCST